MISGIFIIFGTRMSLFRVTQSYYTLTDTLIDWIYQLSIMNVARLACHNEQSRWLCQQNRRHADGQ